MIYFKEYIIHQQIEMMYNNSTTAPTAAANSTASGNIFGPLLESEVIFVVFIVPLFCCIYLTYIDSNSICHCGNKIKENSVVTTV